MRSSPFLFLLLGSLLLTNCKTYYARQDISWKEIETLKDGALLVRLQTSGNKIEKLKEAGELAKALETEKNQKQRNERIAEAFENYFDFCPVYFFYSDNSRKLKKGEFSGILMNSRFETVEATQLGPDAWLMAEFGQTQVSLSEGGGVSRGSIALVIKDRDFIQLQDPFPAYAGWSILKEANEDSSVEKMNQDLHIFYNEAKRKKLKREFRRRKWRDY